MTAPEAIVLRTPFGRLDAYTWDDSRRAGPINLAWRRSLADVVSTLQADGWQVTRGRRRDLLLDGERVPYATDLAVETSWRRRTHVRLWAVDAWTLGQAHYEGRRWFRHDVRSQDAGRDRAARPFAGQFLGVGSTGRRHDGRMFVAPDTSGWNIAASHTTGTG